MTTKKESQEKEIMPKTAENAELSLLKLQLEEIQKKLEDSQVTSVTLENSDFEKVSREEYISVMSLVPYVLNISTEGNGVGRVKRFEKFGQVKRILYGDLAEMIDSNMSFVEAGYLYILNSDVIRQHGLDDIYKNILTKEMILEILETNSNTSLELYKSANASQKEVIIDLLISKILDNPDSVNLNIVDAISRESKIDIMEKVKSSQEIREDRELEK